MCDEIIKAFECCAKNKSCRDCPYIDEVDGRKWCNEKVYDGVISVINRQQAEIERLTNYIVSELSVLPKKVKTETTKEFADRVFELFPYDKNHTTISRITIKQILKEMMEGNENALKERERV